VLYAARKSAPAPPGRDRRTGRPTPPPFLLPPRPSATPREKPGVVAVCVDPPPTNPPHPTHPTHPSPQLGPPPPSTPHAHLYSPILFNSTPESKLLDRTLIATNPPRLCTTAAHQTVVPWLPDLRGRLKVSAGNSTGPHVLAASRSQRIARSNTASPAMAPRHSSDCWLRKSKSKSWCEPWALPCCALKAFKPSARTRAFRLESFTPRAPGEPTLAVIQSRENHVQKNQPHRGRRSSAL